MRATIHLLPFVRGEAPASFEHDLPDAVSGPAAAEVLFEASNCGTATATSRSMSVGDVAEVYSPAGRAMFGCAPSGWVFVPPAMMPFLGRIDAEMRRRVFAMLRPAPSARA